MTQIGCWLTLASPAVAEVLGKCGFDWLCIDQEHSPVDSESTQLMIAAIQTSGTQAWVRVGANDPLLIKKALDAGANGIVVPMIRSREEAVRAVQSCFYPPQGTRGVGLARAQSYGFGFEDYRDRVAPQTRVVLQIEHIDAIQNLDEILGVPGISGTLIGPYDLSSSIGKPGAFDDPKVSAALVRYEELSKKHKVPMGFHVIAPNSELVQEKIQKGYQWIGFSLDSLWLGTYCRSELSKINRKESTL